MRTPRTAGIAGLLAAFLVLQGPVFGTDWTLCSENEFLFLYFKASGITRSEEGLIKVWVKYVPKGQKGREFWAHIRNLEKIPMKQFQGYAYSVVLYELNCQDKVYRLISGIDYNRENRMLAEMPLSKWKPVYPDSLIETLQQAVCPLDR